jgi:hypothetical protein
MASTVLHTQSQCKDMNLKRIVSVSFSVDSDHGLLLDILEFDNKMNLTPVIDNQVGCNNMN